MHTRGYQAAYIYVIVTKILDILTNLFCFLSSIKNSYRRIDFVSMTLTNITYTYEESSFKFIKKKSLGSCYVNKSHIFSKIIVCRKTKSIYAFFLGYWIYRSPCGYVKRYFCSKHYEKENLSLPLEKRYLSCGICHFWEFFELGPPKIFHYILTTSCLVIYNHLFLISIGSLLICSFSAFKAILSFLLFFFHIATELL